jgi:hypothetical protein
VTIKRRRYGRSGHGYTLDGQRAPGVTTILSKTLPKENLIDWAARSGADEAINCWDELAGLPLMARHDRIRNARNRIRDAAAHRGTEVHRLAAQLAQLPEDDLLAELAPEQRGVSVPDELAGHLEAYRDWLDRFEVAPVEGGSELVVASRAHTYCGTADLVADLPSVFCDGELIDACRWLLELKTTASGVWPESALQATAYRRADMYVHPDHPDDEQPMDLLGIKRAGVVWIKSDACELRPVDTGDEAWEYFLRLRWLYDRLDAKDGWIGSPAEAVRVLAATT